MKSRDPEPKSSIFFPLGMIEKCNTRSGRVTGLETGAVIAGVTVELVSGAATGSILSSIGVIISPIRSDPTMTPSLR